MIKSLEIENLFSIEKIVLNNLDEEDVIGITGSYEGKEGYSNGSGKSGVAEAIYLAMTGKHRYKTDIEAIRIGEDFLRVKMIHVHKNSELSIERVLKKKKNQRSTSAYAEVCLNGEIKATGVESSQSFINKYFGVTPEDFVNSHFFRQREYDALLKTRSTERIKFLQKFFKSYIFDQAKKQSGKERLELLSEIKSLEAEIKTSEEEKSSMDKTALKNRMTSSKEKLIALKEKRKNTEKKLEAVRKRREGELKRTAESKSNLEKSNELKKRIKEIAEKRSRLRIKRNGILKRMAEIKCDLSGVTSSILEVPEAGWKEEDDERISGLLTRKEGLLVKIEVNKQKIKTAEDYIRYITSKMCPMCNQEISEEFRKLHSLVKKKEVRQIQEKNKDLEGQHNETISKWTALTSRKQEEEKMDKKRMILDTEKRKLEAVISSENNLSDAISDQVKELKSKSEELIIKKDSVVVISIDTGLIVKLNSEGKKLEIKVSDLNELIEEESVHYAKLENTIQRLEEVVKRLRVAKKNEKIMRQSIADHFTLESIFEKCKLEVVTVGLKEIEETACDIIRQVGAVQKELEFDTQKETQKGISYDCLDIYLIDGKGKRNVMGLCGGEWYTAAFSIRAAMAKYKLTRMNSKVDFMILDEIFGALDTNSRQELAAVVNMFKNDFSQVFVISHTDLKDTISNVIQVEMGKDEITRIKED
ncbi:hypothetical protein LCGC14_0616760 [marine sediment metagenome]|uniref:Rad50/SbcC-type AAA domain-containing protein n=1 Tax=marine sediment metagenome TaxID=412755 RepID=A0A0F9RAU9_9ZZZZ